MTRFRFRNGYCTESSRIFDTLNVAGTGLSYRNFTGIYLWVWTYTDNMIVFIKENSRRAAMAASFMGKPNAAMVIGKTIYLWGASREAFLRDKQWVRHEVVHVLQYQKYGVLLFWWLYLADSVRNGYLDNRFEREARNFEKDKKILDDVVFQ